MIIVLGDIHFRSDYAWFKEAAEKFLEWFESWEYNKQVHELILLGDLVERSVNGGTVISFIEKLANVSKFKKVHILVGNHDFKRIEGRFQLAYEFLRERPSIVIYEEFRVAKIGGLDCAMLPHISPSPEITNPYAYFSSLYKEHKADIVFGHVQDETLSGRSVSNLDKISKHLCLGHIHVRSNERYIGSIYPSNPIQNGPRYFRTYSKIKGSIHMREYPLPNFLTFKAIKYGDKIVNDDDCLVPVYIVNEAPPESLRTSDYSGVHIRKYVRSQSKKLDEMCSKLERKSVN